MPARTAESIALSRDLNKRGFKFVGPTICYAYMQSVGMVNDHLINCFSHCDIIEQLAVARKNRRKARVQACKIGTKQYHISPNW